jgi:hypothetical protein
MNLKMSWQEKARIVNKYHVEQLLNDKTWTIEKTAKALSLSKGATSQFLQLASWIRSHPHIEAIKNVNDALIFIREHRHEMRRRV